MLVASSFIKINFRSISGEGGKTTFTLPGVEISAVNLLPVFKSSKTGAVLP